MDGSQQVQEPEALLETLALGNRQIEAGRVRPAADVVAQLAQLRERRRRCRGVVNSIDG